MVTTTRLQNHLFVLVALMLLLVTRSDAFSLNDSYKKKLSTAITKTSARPTPRTTKSLSILDDDDDDQPKDQPSRRRFLSSSTISAACMLLGTCQQPQPVYASPPSSSQVDIDKANIIKGYQRLQYLLDNWEKETTVCGMGGDKLERSCERTPLKVMDYLGK
jgi:hypothetical protein